MKYWKKRKGKDKEMLLTRASHHPPSGVNYILFISALSDDSDAITLRHYFVSDSE